MMYYKIILIDINYTKNSTIFLPNPYWLNQKDTFVMGYFRFYKENFVNCLTQSNL